MPTGETTSKLLAFSFGSGSSHANTHVTSLNRSAASFKSSFPELSPLRHYCPIRLSNNRIEPVGPGRSDALLGRLRATIPRIGTGETHALTWRCRPRPVEYAAGAVGAQARLRLAHNPTNRPNTLDRRAWFIQPRTPGHSAGTFDGVPNGTPASHRQLSEWLIRVPAAGTS
jgi:hypothetical protein